MTNDKEIKIAVFPGTFDPITNGHLGIIERALPIFDKIYVSIGHNVNKKTMFDLEKRMNWLRETFKNHTNIEVSMYEGLTIDYCNKVDAKYIIRGLRTSKDFEYEQHIAQLNKKMENIDTVFFIAEPKFSGISSTIVRDLMYNGNRYIEFVPKIVRI